MRSSNMTELGYCVKCREKREFKDVEYTKMKNGRPACKGKCIECGTGMYKLISKKHMSDIEESSIAPEVLPESFEKETTETEGDDDVSNS